MQPCLCAARITANKEWIQRAKMCFGWFQGKNGVAKPLYNPEIGGGRDRLVPDGVAPNQGAESTLAYLLSVLELHLYARAQQVGSPSGNGNSTASALSACT